MKLFLDIIRIVKRDSLKYEKIKDTNEKSVYFGVISIVFMFLSLLIGAATIFISLQIFGSIGGSNNVLGTIFLVIVGVALGLCGVFSYLIFLIRGIITACYQIKMPRKTLGIVALIINLLIFAASVCIMILLLKSKK